MRYFLIIIFALSTLNAFAQESFTYYSKGYTYNPQNNVETSATSYPKITQIENNLFHQSFNDDIYARLDRIEQRLYHQNFPQMSLADRIDRISSQVNKTELSSAYVSALDNLEKQVYSRVDTRNDIESRISNLEMSLIGAIQTGDYEDRIQQLKTVSENTCPSMFSLGGMNSSSTYYNEGNQGVPVSSPYTNNSSYSPTASPKGILNDILTIFTGFLGRGYNNYGYNSPYNTGYNNYNNGFFNPNYQNSMYPSNSYNAPNNYNYNGSYNGFNQPTITTQNQYFDSGIGVKILD